MWSLGHYVWLCNLHHSQQSHMPLIIYWNAMHNAKSMNVLGTCLQYLDIALLSRLHQKINKFSIPSFVNLIYIIFFCPRGSFYIVDKF